MRATPHAALVESMLDTDVNHYLPDDLLVKMDVATMACSLEARSPFLDHKLMEFMARVPASMKLRGGESKRILKSALRGILSQTQSSTGQRWASAPRSASGSEAA